MRVVLPDESATIALGERLGAALPGRFVLGLEGPLGAGKTHLTRGIVAGLAPGLARRVASPTYAVCHEYPTSPTLHHLDLYRLASEDDLEGIGFFELVEERVVIEWPDRIPLVSGMLDALVTLERDGDGRLASIEARSPRGSAYLEKLSST